MRLRNLATALTMAGLLSGGTLLANQPSMGGAATSDSSYFNLEQSAGNHQVSYESSYTLQNAPAAPHGNAGTCDACAGVAGACDACGNGCGNGCGNRCGSFSGCGMGDPWKLFDGCMAQRYCLDIGGVALASYFWNPDNPPDGFNGPVTFTDRADEGQLNQLYGWFSRPVNTGGQGFDLGGRIDFLYGTDWRFVPAAGLEINNDGTLNWNQSSRFYGAAIPQAYLEAGLNNLSAKVGHFYSILGYEVVPANGNFFTSHSYLRQYAEPFTHTGVLFNYNWSDDLTLIGGFHRGWNSWSDVEGTLGYLGGFTYALNNRTSVAGSMVWSREAADNTNTVFSDRAVYSAVITNRINSRLTTVFQCDIGHQNASAVSTGAEWYGTAGYTFYQLTDRIQVGTRQTWLRDDDGFIVQGLGTLPGFAGPPARGWSGGGYAGDFYEIAVGANFQATSNLLLRTELRWDWYSGQNGTNAAGLLRPFDDGNDSSQTLLGMSLQYEF